jgi:uncharacterized protein
MKEENRVHCIQGTAGEIELLETIPLNDRKESIAVICHPHPLYGGSLRNKVVSTLARSSHELGIPSIRFNFRGVGQTQGVYDKGIGEVQDCVSVAQYALRAYPNRDLWLMGFSFGAFVAAKAASLLETALLVTVAPPVGKEYFGELPEREKPWILVQSLDDEVIDPFGVFSFYDSLAHKPNLIRFEKAGHFFHGHLVALREQLVETMKVLMMSDV